MRFVIKPRTQLQLRPLVFTAALVAAFAATSYSREMKPRFPNPLSNKDAADPSMLAHEGRLFLYSTGIVVDGGGAYPIRVSTVDDRTSWSEAGGVFTVPTLPKWSGRHWKYWAPEVHRVDGRFVCYYSSWDKNERFCIGAAVCDTPEGPFIDIGAPLVSNPDYGLIDAGYFHDPTTSRSWLMWKEDKNDLDPKQPTDIKIQELTTDGLKLLGESRTMITNDVEWEHELVEAPSLIYRDGYYYLFFSANAFNDVRYGVGVARAENVTGPYVKYAKNPILKSDETFDGPGHQFLYEEKPGVWTMFYHARHLAAKRRSRLLMSDPVQWNDEGWPFINDGTPSNGWTPPPARER